MLNNIKLGPKLIGGFLSVSLIAAVIGIVGIVNLKNLDRADTILYEKITAPITDMTYIIDSYQKIRIDLRDLFRTEDSNINKEKETDIIKLKNIIANHQSNLDKAFLTDEEKKIFQDFKSSLDDYYKILDKMVELGVTNKNIEGYQLMDGDGKIAAANFEKNLNNLMKNKEILSSQTSESNTKLATTGTFATLATVLAGVILSLLIGIFLSLSISRPILMITEGANGFAVGDIELKAMDWNKIAKIIARGDELGDIGKAFAKLIEYQKDKVNIAGEIAKGNIDINVDLASEADKLGIAFKETVSSLNKMISQVNSAVEQTASGSNQVASASQSLSQGATEQASSLEEITSSITEINSQAKQNSENALQASSLAKKSLENSEMGNKQMKELVTSMANITKSADMIKKIVKVIDDIAFQTNLLALNANVEAARAGKYGKGFAVVAEEVRNLAGRSAESVKETTAMVEEAVKNIMNGNSLVELTAKQLDEIAKSANKVSDLVEEIATASREQTQGLEQINQGLGQIDQITQGNTANAEESASAAEELASQAQELKTIIAHFKLLEDNESKQIEESSSENENPASLQKTESTQLTLEKN